MDACMVILRSKLARTLMAMLIIVLAVQLVGWLVYGKEQALAAVCLNTLACAVVMGLFLYQLFRMNAGTILVYCVVLFVIRITLMHGNTPRSRDSLFHYAMQDFAGSPTGAFETGMAMDFLLFLMVVIMIITAFITAKVTKMLSKDAGTGTASL